MANNRNISTIDEQLIRTTVRIVAVGKNGVSTGTGFFYKFIIDNKIVPVIVTNKHVLSGSEVVELNISCFDDEIKTIKRSFPIVDQLIIKHPNPDVDLCLIKIAPLLNSLTDKMLKVVFLKEENIITDAYVSENVSNIEDITIVGYPDGIIDEFNNLPIVRKGITATSVKYDFNGKKEFLIDSAIYGGSSGSPVYIFNQGSYSIKNTLYAGDRLFLIGIVYAVAQHRTDGSLKIRQAPTNSILYPETYIPNNLGVVIKARRILDFNPIIKQILDNGK